MFFHPRSYFISHFSLQNGEQKIQREMLSEKQIVRFFTFILLFFSFLMDRLDLFDQSIDQQDK